MRPPIISVYDTECHEVALFCRKSVVTDCPLPVKIDPLGEGKDIMITKLDEAKREFAFEYGGRSYGSSDGVVCRLFEDSE